MHNFFRVFVFGCCLGITAMTQAAVAIFAGGCFWCMQPPFDKTPGVQQTIVGYTGGHVVDPSYKQVSSGTSGHVEAMKIVYDPTQVSYEQLLKVFWQNIDPEDEGGQFCDRGEQYRSVIFYLDKNQKSLAEASKKTQQKKFKQVATDILKSAPFYPAEDYHQNYYQKNPIRYKYYRYRCGRDQRLEALRG